MGFSEAYKELKNNRSWLSKQQYKTLLGQAKSGNIDGMLKGLNKLKRGVA